MLAALACVMVASGCGPGGSSQRPETFEEMADPTADTLVDWSGVAGGLNVSFAPTSERYPRSVAPGIAPDASCRLTGWRGERLSAQVLLWSAEDAGYVECRFRDFKSGRARISASAARARFVRYVMTDEFGPGCGYRKPEDFASSLSPDMLDDLECFFVKGKEVRPVWITIDVPSDTRPGTYEGRLDVVPERGKKRSLKISIEVAGQTLPPASEWAYHLDLWQHPAAVARAEGHDLWSDAHFDAMRRDMKLLADAGQKVITTTLNVDPWNNQSYDAYADMIVWTKHPDGRWGYDYTIFDRWVEMMMELGVNRQINCYSMLPWNNMLHYVDASTGKYVDVKADPGTGDFYAMWKPFLTDFVAHLREKGWLSITNIAMDERSPEDMQHTTSFLGEHVPELGIALADNHKSYLRYPYIKDMCVGLEARVDSAVIESRRREGLITTYYVCCSHPFPNLFTFSSPDEATYAAWYAVACGYDGFLRWAYNCWTEYPLTDSRFRTWPAGDTYVIYPGARSSIRFERLVEGVQDAEKIRILREKFTAENTPESLCKLRLLNKTVKEFATDKPSESPSEMLRHAKDLLVELSR